eukprot:TRINITY_DN42120_c0_g1_i1.p1 TRINITY_DN42120_c0_g1~~TRINITY_DN42120_c0_g1_i1.p1  ORF type:complete len:381 (+),score=75.21 TRINITY_DN42120_c0_g1_i1:106-1248(+)
MDDPDAPLCAEFQDLLPPEAEFEVRTSDQAGRYMVAREALPAGHDFLIESPLVAWPLVSDLALAENLDAADARPASAATCWCEACFRACDADAEGSARRVRRRLASGERGPSSGGLLCDECSGRSRIDYDAFFTAELLWRWRRWQAKRSPNSRVGLEAFGRCLALIACTAAQAREQLEALPDEENDGGAPEAMRSEALHIALRPFDRLAAPPEGGGVSLHGTSAKEVAEELAASEPFASALTRAVGCEELAKELLSEHSIDGLAGRLVLNAAGIEVGPAKGHKRSSEDEEACLRGAGLFMLLATMNHACGNSAAATFEGQSNEVTLRTTRAVAAGEPLTLSYVPGDWPRKERRDRLRHWFFECDCYRCTAEGCIEAAVAP